MPTSTSSPIRPDQQIGLIAAFLNPLAFAASGPTPEEATGAIVRGVTRQVGNEIDEFVTEALRNNLLGLPLDLPAHQPGARPRHRHSVPERGARASSTPRPATASSSPTRAGPTSCST